MFKPTWLGHSSCSGSSSGYFGWKSGVDVTVERVRDCSMTPHDQHEDTSTQFSFICCFSYVAWPPLFGIHVFPESPEWFCGFKKKKKVIREGWDCNFKWTTSSTKLLSDTALWIWKENKTKKSVQCCVSFYDTGKFGRKVGWEAWISAPMNPFLLLDEFSPRCVILEKHQQCRHTLGGIHHAGSHLTKNALWSMCLKELKALSPKSTFLPIVFPSNR